MALVALLAAAAVFAGCDKSDDESHGPGRDHDHAEHATGGAAAPAPTNRIDVPDRVRQNLGITFAKVEQRRVASTLRVPGRFELEPAAKREYRTVLPARVELLVKQYDRVEPGQVLARLDSPDWRRVQHEAVEAEGEIKVADANADVTDAARAENQRAVDVLRKRTAALAEANATRADLAAELSLAEGKAARLDAEVRAARVKAAEAREHYASKLRTLASVIGLPAERLVGPATQPAAATQAAAASLLPRDGAASLPAPPAADRPPPAATTSPAPAWWTAVDAIEVRAADAGVVQSLAVTNGGWADAGGLVLSVVDPRRVRFRASALQSDLGRIRDGAPALIVAPGGVAIAAAAAGDATPGAAGEAGGTGVPAKVALALEADPDARTLELVLAPERPAAWARPGVSAFAEVVTEGSDDPEAAVPVAAVVQDELAKVYFRRDPKDPDKVIRVEADLGVSDGRWVVVNSGLKAGDEVVLDGVFELKLAGGGKPGGAGAGSAGGHFHADGTWHAAGTPEPGGKK